MSILFIQGGFNFIKYAKILIIIDMADKYILN